MQYIINLILYETLNPGASDTIKLSDFCICCAVIAISVKRWGPCLAAPLGAVWSGSASFADICQ